MLLEKKNNDIVDLITNTKSIRISIPGDVQVNGKYLVKIEMYESLKAMLAQKLNYEVSNGPPSN